MVASVGIRCSGCRAVEGVIVVVTSTIEVTTITRAGIIVAVVGRIGGKRVTVVNSARLDSAHRILQVSTTCWGRVGS